MFTGIIEETGKIQTISDKKISIECSKVLEGTKIGDSIAVNGICLTLVSFTESSFVADVSPETYRVTILKNLKQGDLVNLERAMSINDRFGGHIVSGHIDGIGKVFAIKKNNDFYNFEIELNKNESKYAIKKGSITINGISLTIAEINNNKISLAIIPHTFENTNLKQLKIGDYVNIEVDIFAKYIEKFLSTSDNKTGIDLDFLQRNGF